MPDMDHENAKKTVRDYNNACNLQKDFDPTILDNLSTSGIKPPKSNWAQQLNSPPFRAYPVTGGITFTYGGLKVSSSGAVMKGPDETIKGLFACGELIGGVFFNGYPGGSGLTSGLVFGRQAGFGAAGYTKKK
jgi:tricarballylate dehydrogenase